VSAPVDPGTTGGRLPLAAGELVEAIDAKGRRYLFTLAEGGEFHTHAGPVPHDQLIGADEGCEARSSKGARYLVWRPTLAQFVLGMPRGAQVIYPKDLGAILMAADIFPGARVFESGLGSGALSMVLLRAGAVITGYEIRSDFAERARRNVTAFLGEDVLDRYGVHERDAYDGIDGTGYDRVVLDLPEPWQVVPHAAGALRPGGILCAYTPSVVQVIQTRAALEEHGFSSLETLEVLHRSWHVEDPAVRPAHRMVGHTGFITHGRRLAT